MLLIELLIDAFSIAFIALAAGGGCLTGFALRDRYHTLSAPSTTQARPPVYIHPPRPPFSDICPPVLPVQLRYLPLAATAHNEPLVLCQPYGFIPVAMEHIRPNKDIPPCVAHPPTAKRCHHRTTKEFSLTDNLPARLLVRLCRSVWRALRVIAVLFVSMAILVHFPMLVIICLELHEKRQLSRRATRLHNAEHAHLMRMEHKNEGLARTLQEVASQLEQRVTERDRYRPAAADFHRYRRVAAFLEDKIVDLTDALDDLDTKGDFWSTVLKNADPHLTAVTRGTQANVPPATLSQAPATPPPLL